MESETKDILVLFQCETEEACARVLEVLSRAVAGLVLDGTNVMFMRPDNQD